jgi:hypothetical protein
MVSGGVEVNNRIVRELVVLEKSSFLKFVADPRCGPPQLHVPHIHAYEDVNSLPSEAAHFRKGTQL